MQSIPRLSFRRNRFTAHGLHRDHPPAWEWSCANRNFRSDMKAFDSIYFCIPCQYKSLDGTVFLCVKNFESEENSWKNTLNFLNFKIKKKFNKKILLIPSNDLSWWDLQKIFWVKKFHIGLKNFDLRPTTGWPNQLKFLERVILKRLLIVTHYL